MISFAVVVPVHNKERHIARTLDGLRTSAAGGVPFPRRVVTRPGLRRCVLQRGAAFGSAVASYLRTVTGGER